MSSPIEMMLQGTVMAVVVLALRRPLLRLLPASFTRLLWVAVAARLLVPFPTPFTLAVLPAPSTHGPVPAPPAPHAEGPWVPAAARMTQAAPDALSTADVAVLVWAAGALLCLATFAARYARLLRSLRGTRPPEGVPAEIRAGRRKAAVRTTPGISSPLTCGVLRPVVLVPPGFDARGSLEDGMALSHELVHVSRMDAALKLLMSVACCVYWFDPVVHLARRAAARDIELACDEAVLVGRPGAERRAYAVALVDAAARAQEPQAAAAAYSAAAAGCLRERVLRIKRPNGPFRPLAAAVAAVACAALALAALAWPEPSAVTGVGVGDAYSFSIPEQWLGRVEARTDGEEMAVYPLGQPGLPLLSVSRRDSTSQGAASNDGYKLVWSAQIGGSVYEARAINYPSMAADGGWAAAAAANPPYPGAEAEREVVSLSTGDAPTASDATGVPARWAAWEDFYRDVVSQRFKVSGGAQPQAPTEATMVEA